MLRLYDSQKKEKCVFTPRDPQCVQMYVCGPTVYSSPHIGNARPAVVFDVLFRILQQHYPKVNYVRNLTDVDDKINRAAQQEGVDIDVISSRYSACYHHDVAALGCLEPSIEPRATAHIEQMITAIATLIARGHAYVSAQHVLFSVASYPGHGCLSGRRSENNRAGARVEVAAYKRDPADFVLWKPAEPDTPSWDSPWGAGRPGWHIECTAMIVQHCGLPVDIHGGGGDLLFPHHENEQAQGCCLADEAEYCRYWLHNGMIHMAEDKMSKSLGNIVLVTDLLAQYPGEVIRLVFLQTHYRQPMHWRDDLLKQAKSVLDRLYRALLRSPALSSPAQWDDIPAAVRLAFLDDMNLPLVLTHWQQTIKQLLVAVEPTQQAQLLRELVGMNEFLGLGQQDPQQWFLRGVGQLDVSAIEAQLLARDRARAKKDYMTADAIRAKLQQQGIVLEDGPDGTSWQTQ